MMYRIWAKRRGWTSKQYRPPLHLHKGSERAPGEVFPLCHQLVLYSWEILYSGALWLYVIAISWQPPLQRRLCQAGLPPAPEITSPQFSTICPLPTSWYLPLPPPISNVHLTKRKYWCLSDTFLSLIQFSVPLLCFFLERRSPCKLLDKGQRQHHGFWCLCANQHHTVQWVRIKEKTSMQSVQFCLTNMKVIFRRTCLAAMNLKSIRYPCRKCQWSEVPRKKWQHSQQSPSRSRDYHGQIYLCLAPLKEWPLACLPPTQTSFFSPAFVINLPWHLNNQPLSNHLDWRRKAASLLNSL